MDTRDLKIVTGTYSDNTTLPLIEGFTEEQCHFIWFSHGNYYGGWTKDIVPTVGFTRQAKIPYDGACGWKGGAYMVIGIKDLPSVRVITGNIAANMTLPIPDGFNEADCTFFWMTYENYYGGFTGDVVPAFGNTRNATLPYNGAGGWKGGGYIVIARQSTSSIPMEISSGTFSINMTLDVPQGYNPDQCHYLWGCHENYYSASTGDLVPKFGVSRELIMPYNGAKYWKGGAWLRIAVKPPEQQ